MKKILVSLFILVLTAGLCFAAGGSATVQSGAGSSVVLKGAIAENATPTMTLSHETYQLNNVQVNLTDLSATFKLTVGPWNLKSSNSNKKINYSIESPGFKLDGSSGNAIYDITGVTNEQLVALETGYHTGKVQEFTINWASNEYTATAPAGDYAATVTVTFTIV